MKYIAIIFSIIFSIVSLILGQFIHPLIASFFDASPIPFLVIFKLVILISIIILTVKLTKEKGIRFGIVFPYLVSFIISIVLISIKFGESTYYNGYAESGGDLINSIGIEVISGTSWGSEYFKCIDKNGNNIIVECFTEEDEDYEEDSDGEYRYFVEIKVYDENYQFLWRAETDTYDEYYPSTYDIQEFIDGWKGITVDKQIGS